MILIDLDHATEQIRLGPALERAVNWLRWAQEQNLPDGRVEIEAEGDGDAMERFEMAVRQGPSHARVDNVEVDILPPSGHRSPFYLKG